MPSKKQKQKLALKVEHAKYGVSPLNKDATLRDCHAVISLLKKRAKIAAKIAKKVAAAQLKAKKAAKNNFIKNKKKIEKIVGSEIKYYYCNHFILKKAKFSNPIEEIAYYYEKDKRKECTKCGKEKRYVCYSKNDCGKGNIIRGDGLRNRRPDCRVCCEIAEEGKKMAKAWAKEKGIHKAPEGTHCRLCNCLSSKSNKIVFDHCHETNVFRGYCCNKCNKGMGLLGDSILSIANVLKYMNETEKLSKEKVLKLLGYD